MRRITYRTAEGAERLASRPLWMKPGDICGVHVKGVSTLSNSIAGETDA